MSKRMGKHETQTVYRTKGQRPEGWQIHGRWRVKMWGWYRWMRLDTKTIDVMEAVRNGHIENLEAKTELNIARGYNSILGVKWGRFSVVQVKDVFEIRYDNGKMKDTIKVLPGVEGLILGMFYNDGELKAPFSMKKVKEIDE